MTTKEDFFQVLGHITVFFSTLDVLTTIFINQQIKPEYQSKFKDSTTLKQKYRILEKFNNENFVSSGIYQEFSQLLPEAIELSEKRNRFIHDQWIFDPKNVAEGKIARGTLKVFKTGKWKMPKEFHSINELYEFLNDLGDLQNKVGRFIQL